MIQSSARTPPSSTLSNELIKELIDQINRCEHTLLRIHPENFGSGDVIYFRKFVLDLLAHNRKLAGWLGEARDG